MILKPRLVGGPISTGAKMAENCSKDVHDYAACSVPLSTISDDDQYAGKKRRRSGSMENINAAGILKQCAPEGERVVILDAGAQYGKVQSRIYDVQYI